MAVERITAPAVKKYLDEHLHEHLLKFNTKLHEVYHAVLGEQGKGGLCNEVDQIKGDIKTIDTRFKSVCDDISEIKDSLKWVTRLVLGAVIMAILGLVFVK